MPAGPDPALCWEPLPLCGAATPDRQALGPVSPPTRLQAWPGALKGGWYWGVQGILNCKVEGGEAWVREEEGTLMGQETWVIGPEHPRMLLKQTLAVIRS